MPDGHEEICTLVVGQRRWPTSSQCRDFDGYFEKWCLSLSKQKCHPSLSTVDEAACALFFPAPAAGTVTQPKGNALCSLYAPANALELIEGGDWEGKKCEVAHEIIEEYGTRLGGNPQKMYQEFYKRVYGLRATQFEPAKSKWAAAFKLADEEKIAVSIGVTWSKGTKSGNHWVYFSGLSGGKVIARDQQNGNLEITIDPSARTGEAAGGWTYVVTKVSMAVTSENYHDVSTALR